MDYLERIEQVGQGKKPTKLVQAALDEYESVIDAINQGRAELEDADDEEREGIQNDLTELEETAELMLMKLNKAIDKWADGIKRIDNMNKKKGQPTAPAGQPAPAAAATIRTPQPQTPAKKEESGYGWLIFGGLALVLSLGAINVMKK